MGATEAATKVAVITGGANGIGFAVAQALASRGGWQIHILDIKEDDGQKAASALAGTVFHKTDLTKYDELGAAIKAAFTAGGRLDFVFANAGIFERSNAYEPPSASPDIPPEPDYSPIDLNLRACLNTAHIARHFISRSPEKGSIVLTGSMASVWPSSVSPVYTASKHGVLGFMRAVAGPYKQADGIRINALLPGPVRTAILPAEGWNMFPEDVFTPLDALARAVLVLLDGKEIVDSKGVRVPPEKIYGQAIVVSEKKLFVMEAPEYADEILAKTIEAVKVKDPDGGVLDG